MASINITNKSTGVVSTVFGPVGVGQTRNFANISQTAFNAALSALNTLTQAGTINYCAVSDGTGLNQGADVQNVFGSLGIGVVPTNGGFGFAGNIEVVQPVNGDGRFLVFAQGDQGGITDGLWSWGSPYTAGVGLQAVRWLYSDASTPEHIVASMESQGTFGMVGNNDQRSRVEGYDIDGQVNPTFRVTTYPSMSYEWGQLMKVAAIGGMTRSSSTVTVNIVAHNFETGQVLSLTCADTNYASAVNAYTITRVDADHFTFSLAGTTVASTAVGIFSVETTMKLRLAGNQHLQLIIGPYSGEAVGVEWYADAMVTATGYGMSYGGSVLYQPTTVTHAASPYALAAGSTYLCDATAGAITFNLPASGTYYGKPGRTITVVKVDSGVNAVTITGSGGVVIGGSATKALALQYNSATLTCDGGNNWYVVGSN